MEESVGMRILCRRCSEIPPDSKDLAAELDRAVARIPQGERTEEKAYEARLAACEACPHRAFFTCLKCGCYCQIRAAVKRNRCPRPGNPAW